jgi:shikimate kinase
VNGGTNPPSGTNKKRMKLYLLGYMYSGKTTVGRSLAQQLGFGFVDLDQLFEERYHTSIPLFFNRYGEDAFRKLEQLMLHSTETMDNAVISTGGGTPCYFDNMEWMNQHGLTVFLRISEKAVVDRLLHAKRKRPLAVGKSEEELAEFVAQHYTSRLPFYEQAKITVKSEDLDLVNLMEKIKGFS